jgi:hypothetical protein
VATSLNFMLPLGVLLDKALARHLAWASPLGIIGGVGLRIAEDGVLASVLGTVNVRRLFSASDLLALTAGAARCCAAG